MSQGCSQITKLNASTMLQRHQPTLSVPGVCAAADTRISRAGVEGDDRSSRQRLSELALRRLQGEISPDLLAAHVVRFSVKTGQFQVRRKMRFPTRLSGGRDVLRRKKNAVHERPRCGTPSDLSDWFLHLISCGEKTVKQL